MNYKEIREIEKEKKKKLSDNNAIKRPVDNVGFGNISPLKNQNRLKKRRLSDESFNSVMTGMTGLTKVTGI